MPDGITVYNYASKAVTYRSTAYTARLKSIGPIVTQLGQWTRAGDHSAA
jgi:hypothetical protein